MKHLKKITLLHSNDMHGDFMPKEANGKTVGGVSLLSGYVNKVRKEEKNVIYAISGDMFRGSLIDSEFKGLSTIQIMNMLSPDVVSLGNHEVDYGIAHLLFIEKCADFPIINANIYLTTNHIRLFKSHIILEIDGIKIMFIGILTDDVLNQTRQDRLLGSFLDVKEAASEIGKIYEMHKDEDIDFSVLLTHIGIEADKELAAELNPNWNIDIIIGGHSHTLIKKPVEVAGIPIVQAGWGTSHIGRFDIVIDSEKNCIDSYRWKLVSVSEETSEKNEELEDLVLKYKEETDLKYERVITRFAKKYTHPVRNQETELGRVIADAFKNSLDIDIMLLGSGSIRGECLGPIVKYRDLVQIFPYNNEIYRVYVTGAQLRRMVKHILRNEAFCEHTEFYQFSKGMKIEYNREKGEFTELSLYGKAINNNEYYRIGLQVFHLTNIKEFLNVSEEEISVYKRPKVITTCCTDVLEEYFSHYELITVSDEQRLILT